MIQMVHKLNIRAFPGKCLPHLALGGPTFPMPMYMGADRAAGIIRRGLAKNRARIAFPWPIYAVAWMFGVLPPWLIDPFMVRLPKKA